MEITTIIRHAAAWRTHWHRLGDQEMLRLLTPEQGEVAAARRAFVLTSQRRFDEARAEVTGDSPLEVSTRAAIDIHESAGLTCAPAEALFERVRQMSALVPQVGDLETRIEAQATLDLMRGQAYQAAGHKRKARELFKSSVKLGGLIGMNTSYAESLLDRQRQSPQQCLAAEKRRVIESRQKGDFVNAENAALKVLELKAMLFDLGEYRYYLSLLQCSSLKTTYSHALNYCLTHRLAQLPEEGVASIGDFVRRIHLLERALFAEWTFGHEEACKLAHELLALPGQGSRTHASDRLLRARAHMILHDWPSAKSEIEAAAGAPPSLRRLLQIECAVLSRQEVENDWLHAANTEHPEFMQSIIARLMPNALVLMADVFGDEWRTLSRNRVHPMSESLYRTGSRHFQSQEDRKRVEDLTRSLTERPLSVAYSFLMPAKEIS